MYINLLKWKIIKTALYTRLFAVILQFFGNIIIPDHDAGVFLYPKTNIDNNYLDNVIVYVFGGFLRWDAQYFINIAQHGYIYENSLAFFPAFPYSIRYLSRLLQFVFPFINNHSCLILTSLIFNSLLFVFTSLILFKLSCIILKDIRYAYNASILFCINPATIFFVAPYTECLFSFLSFYSMLNYIRLKQQFDNNPDMKLSWKHIFYLLPFCFMSCTRSNGILNLGFILYFFLYAIVNRIKKCFKSSIYCILDNVLSYIIFCVTATLITVTPFVFTQFLHYNLFCKNFDHNLPRYLIEYAEINGYVLPGKFSLYNQTWCNRTIPLAYSYVQNKYWNVGFLKYYEFKQIPNFLLAAPIIFIILKYSIIFFFQHKEYCIYLGLRKNERISKNKMVFHYNPDMFIFIIHGFLLTIFCVLFVHIQVTTRMLCSASPILYWFCTYKFKKDSEVLKFSFDNEGKFISSYFLSYSIVGTVMFSNFLPWT